MVGTSVLKQSPLLIAHDDHRPCPAFSYRLKEEECVSVIKKCKNLEEIKQVHGHILRLGLFWSSFCASNLVATCALSDWGSMDYACSIFRQIDEPSSFAFNAMIRGHVNEMKLEEALFMYHAMIEMGVTPDNFTYPILLKASALSMALGKGMQIHGHIFKLGLEDDVFVQNSLIHLYGKCGEIRLSSKVFYQMEQRTIASWSALIAAHANLGMWHDCLRLFGEMNSEGCWKPEESILVSVLSVCTHLGALDLGRCTHGHLLRNFCGLNLIVETSLIDMYVKCGSLEHGQWLFRRMAKKNKLSYSAMISGLAMHGHGQEALSIFLEMLREGLEPDDVVYVGVLNACSHAGLFKEGAQFFHRMMNEHGINPTIQHFGCLVDLMGRAGMLNEAFELIESMPLEPNDVLWRSLLSACKLHGNVELGEIAGRNLLKLNSQNAGDYLVLSNMYAQAQRWEDMTKVRTRMADKGLLQTPGFSLVEVKRKVYRFVSQDVVKFQCEDVYEMLHQMEWQLKFEGYLPDTSQVLLDVDEEEKKQRLSRHSQKLAIAFALIHTFQGSPIRIVRNLRMCSDCHTYTKLISMIYKRSITVRDRNRFHHFRDGTCSCRDYW